MNLVTLVSGGIDSAVMTILASQEGITVHPLFIDYGQLAAERELEACRLVHLQFELPSPKVMNVSGYGQMISSGLTDKQLDVYLDAFLPGRNALFLLVASAYAASIRADAVAIGLLGEDSRLFPDQSKIFLEESEKYLSISNDRTVKILAPLIDMTKNDIVRTAQSLGIEGTYSCHAGGATHCGECVACKEFEGTGFFSQEGQ